MKSLKEPNEVNIDGLTLDQILKQHQQWMDNKMIGSYADLEFADLSGINLSCINLTGVNLTGANLTDSLLEGANLTGAYIRGADFKGASLDYSCMQLSCGDLHVHYDDKQIIQQLYHVLSHIKNSKNASEEIKELLNETNLKWANKFHRVKECGKIKKED